MKTVFILQHSYELDGLDETKMIGAYSSAAEAELAVERAKKLPGFCDHPDAFIYDEYTLNQDNWTEGFSTITTILVEDIEGEWKAVVADVLIDGNYRIV